MEMDYKPFINKNIDRLIDNKVKKQLKGKNYVDAYVQFTYNSKKLARSLKLKDFEFTNFCLCCLDILVDKIKDYIKK